MSKSPTKREVAGALSRMHSIAQQLYTCYANDVQRDRAKSMEALAAKAEKEAEILWRLPPDYGR